MLICFLKLNIYRMSENGIKPLVIVDIGEVVVCICDLAWVAHLWWFRPVINRKSRPCQQFNVADTVTMGNVRTPAYLWTDVQRLLGHFGSFASQNIMLTSWLKSMLTCHLVGKVATSRQS